METIAKKLEYNGEYYEFSHAKKNILTYIKQPSTLMNTGIRRQFYQRMTHLL